MCIWAPGLHFLTNQMFFLFNPFPCKGWGGHTIPMTQHRGCHLKRVSAQFEKFHMFRAQLQQIRRAQQCRAGR